MIRRDTVPAVGKILAKSLEMLFRTRDLSRVKAYLEDTWRRMEEGEGLNLADFVFAREFRGRNGCAIFFPCILITSLFHF